MTQRPIRSCRWAQVWSSRVTQPSVMVAGVYELSEGGVLHGSGWPFRARINDGADHQISRIGGGAFRSQGKIGIVELRWNPRAEAPTRPLREPLRAVVSCRVRTPVFELL